jgi:hypothetical protein
MVAHDDYLALPPEALTSVIVGSESDYVSISKIVAEHAPALRVRRAMRVANHYKLQIIN